MASLAESYPILVAALAEHYGQPQPVTEKRSGFEAVLMAALARSADSIRGQGVIEALEGPGLLDARMLCDADPSEVLDLLRDAGLNPAARSVALMKRLARWYSKTFDSDEPIQNLDAGKLENLRTELATINGVGRATADTIMMALGQSAYPVDRGTYRILLRHGWIDTATDYDQASDLLSRQAAGDSEQLACLSSWLVQVGRKFCGPRSPKCQRCPLRCVLPEQGPIEPEG